LKFYYAPTKKRPKHSHLSVFGDSLTFACSRKTVHQHTELGRWLSFWLERYLTSAPMLLIADTMNVFSSANQIQFTVGAG